VAGVRQGVGVAAGTWVVGGEIAAPAVITGSFPRRRESLFRLALGQLQQTEIPACAGMTR